MFNTKCAKTPYINHMEINMTALDNFIAQSHNDLGENSYKLLELARTYRNARFMDLGVRFGVSSACMSDGARERNNAVHGCDISFRSFYQFGAVNLVDEDYTMYQADSVTLGKNWDEDPFDIIFVDTLHTREQVLAELYYWIHHLNEGGWFVFHDSNWVHSDGERMGDVFHQPIDVAITDFFNLPQSVREYDTYEDDNVLVHHYKPSYGMTFVKVKNLNAISEFKENIDWDFVWERRNFLADMVFNPNSPKFMDWQQDFNNIEFELTING